MIFSAPRFVIIDDNKTHLQAISDCLQSLGTASAGIHYNVEEENSGIDENLLRGVRCLFMDLHLTPGGTLTSDDNRAYSVIAQILETNINKDGGPFLLVLWTEFPEKVDRLQEYLDDANTFSSDKLYAKPFAILNLSKKDFIDIDTGKVEKPQELRNQISSHLKSSPPFSALLAWEANTLVAAGDVLVSIMDLIPADKKNNSDFPAALDELLSRLAAESVGKQNVRSDCRSAVLTALLPILSDRIINQSPRNEHQNLWQQAITKHSGRLSRASSSEAAKINQMLHIAFPQSENISPTDLGAVVEYPFCWDNKNVKIQTGLPINGIVRDGFCIAESDVPKCIPILIRIGAPCDFAQNQPGRLLYLLGILVPDDVNDAEDSNGNPQKRSDGIWESPLLMIDDTQIIYRIFTNIRFAFSFTSKECKNYTVKFRIRDQLLMHLITKAGSHVSRPGIISIRP